MKKPPFFSQNELGITAKCLGGLLKDVSGLTGKPLLTRFRQLYPKVATGLLGRPVTLADLEAAYQLVTTRPLTDNILSNRFDKFIRYSEVNPAWAKQVKDAMIQLPTKATRTSNVKNPAPVPTATTPIIFPTPRRERFVKADRVAKYLSCSKTTVYRYALKGYIRSHRIAADNVVGGYNVRFLMSEVERDITVTQILPLPR